jgi:hypothetical protein
MRNRQIGFEGGMKVSVKKKDMYSEFPLSKKWFKAIKKLAIDKEKFDKQKVEFFYACSFNVPTNPEELNEYLQDAEYATTLPYTDRLSFELSNLNIHVYVKHMGFAIGDKIKQNEIPERVIKVVEEIVKVKMLVEYELHGIEELKLTIPPIDTTKVDMSHINREIQALKEQVTDESELDIDTILDKINKYGLSSITEREIEFLNKQSRL